LACFLKGGDKNGGVVRDPKNQGNGIALIAKKSFTATTGQQ
jgi:hypothetical protein